MFDKFARLIWVEGKGNCLCQRWKINLNVVTYALKSIMNYESLGLEEKFQKTCFGHAFSKACEYGIAKEKVGKIWNMFPLTLLKQICKSASLGLKNIRRESRNGI